MVCWCVHAATERKYSTLLLTLFVQLLYSTLLLTLIVQLYVLKTFPPYQTLVEGGNTMERMDGSVYNTLTCTH